MQYEAALHQTPAHMKQSVYTHGRPCDVPLPFDYTHGPKIIKHATLLFLSFCYAHKRPSPFFLVHPHQKPSFNDKVWTYYQILVSKWVKSQKRDKTGPPTNPATAPQQKFLLLWRYLFMGVKEMRIKNITVTVSVRVSVTVRVSSVWFSLICSFGGV